MDENLYRCVKQLESTAQSMMFALPHPESPAYKALRLPAGQEWKMGQLIDALIWVQNKAKEAATTIYMQGKE